MSKTTAVATLQRKAFAVGQSVLLEFNADYSDPANKEWSQYTPALSLTVHVKPEVAERFDLGDSYVLTFEKRDAPTT